MDLSLPASSAISCWVFRLLCIDGAILYIVCMASGLPVWWHTTRISRPPLPRERIQTLSSLLTSSSKLKLPLHFTIYSLLPRGVDILRDTLSARVVHLVSENASAILENLEDPVKSMNTSFLEIISTVQFVDLMDPLSAVTPEERCLLDTFLTDSPSSGSAEETAMDLEKCFRTRKDPTSYHILLFPSTSHITVSSQSMRTGVLHRYRQGK